MPKIITSKIYVSANGIHEFSNFEKHTIEDHGVLLLLLKDPSIKDRIKESKSAQNIISKDTLLKPVKESTEKEPYKAFRHVCCLLRNL